MRVAGFRGECGCGASARCGDSSYRGERTLEIRVEGVADWRGCGSLAAHSVALPFQAIQRVIGAV